MSRLTNILSVVKGAGDVAKKRIRRQLSIIRSGSEKRMSTFNVLSESIKSEVVNIGGNRITLVVTTPHKYGAILDKGIDQTKVPFSPGSGAGPNPGSDYITALSIWAAKKFYGGNLKAGLKAAFRIARKQKGATEQTFANTGTPANPGFIKEIKKDLDKELVKYMRDNVMIAISMDTRKVLHRTI